MASKMEIMSGMWIPYWIIPGALSVSRAFGDIWCKLKKFNGNPKVLIAEPDVFTYNIST